MARGRRAQGGTPCRGAPHAGRRKQRPAARAREPSRAAPSGVGPAAAPGAPVRMGMFSPTIESMRSSPMARMKASPPVSAPSLPADTTSRMPALSWRGEAGGGGEWCGWRCGGEGGEASRLVGTWAGAGEGAGWTAGAVATCSWPQSRRPSRRRCSGPASERWPRVAHLGLALVPLADQLVAKGKGVVLKLQAPHGGHLQAVAGGLLRGAAGERAGSRQRRRR